MKILMCSRVAPIPPIMDGLRLQVAALSTALAEHHEVRLLALADRPAETTRDGVSMRLVEHHSPDGVQRLMELAVDQLARRPFGLRGLAAAFAGPVEEELRDFDPDVVHVASGKLGLVHRLLNGRPAVLAALDATHLNIEAQAATARGVTRRYHLHQSSLMRRFISEEFDGFDRIVVVTEEDRSELADLTSRTPIDVVTNGVDAARFAPDTGLDRDPDRILFTGALNYPPNVTAALYLAYEVLPIVRRSRPNATLALVGRAPAPDVIELASQPGVEVVGEVPEMGPWLSTSGVYACPMMSGTGIKNKLLEALANGLPCVATPTAVQGTGLVDGHNVLIGVEAPALAQHLVTVLEDVELASALGAAGRSYVLDHHSWEAVGRSYARLYAAAIEGRHGVAE